jgi:DNA-binding beta-propeller fold protein YncE
MTRRLSIRTLSMSVALLFSGAALAVTIGLSGNLDSFSSALGTLHATLQPLADGGDKLAKKQIATIIKLDAALAKPSVSKSYANEMKAAGKAAGKVASKLGSEATLVAALQSAETAYRADLTAARNSLEASLATLSGKALKSAQKKLTKADAKLALADAAPTLEKQFKLLAAAAKLLAPTPGAAAVDVDGVPVAIAIDSTGAFAYVADLGHETGPVLYDGDLRQMAVAADGSLSYLATPSIVSVLHPSAVVAHPSKGFVYVGGHGILAGQAGGASAPDGIAQYAIGADGQLEPLSPPNVAMTNDAAIAALGIDASGTWLWALGTVYNGSPITCFKIESDGTLTEKDHDFAAPSGLAVTVPPGGLHVWTSTSYENGSTLHPEIRDFSNDGLGNVAWVGGYGAANYYFGITVSPDGGVVYAARYNPSGAGDVRAFSVGVDGALAEFGTPPAAGNFPDAIAITPDGKWVYVGNRTDNTISQYAVGLDATLTAQSPATVAAPAPSALRITPDGKFLLVTNNTGIGAVTSLVTVLSIGADGKLSTP